MKKFLVAAIIFISFTTQAQKKGESIHDWSKCSNVYEINVRQFSPAGTFAEVEKQIPRLKKMGVEILWLMPIHPIGLKGRKKTENDLGSYYSVQNYRGINPEFGTEKDFQSLVKTAHKEKCKIIIDWVANHSALDHPWVSSHPDFYVHDSSGNIISPFDWTDVYKLNYKNKALRDSMTESMKYWISKFDIDGFRCDVAEEVPTDFWKSCINKLKENKDLFMLAEGNKAELHRAGFDATYNWTLMGDMKDLYEKKINLKTFEERVTQNQKSFPSGSLRLNFTSNHDENSWNGTEFEKYGDAYKAFAVFAFSAYQSLPLIYNGQEFSNNKRLAFFTKDEIDWSGSSLVDFYETLLNLKRNNDAMAADIPCKRIKTTADASVLAYIKESDLNRVVVLINMSGETQKFTTKDESVSGKSFEIFSKTKETISTEKVFLLNPWEYKILVYRRQ